MRRATGRFFMLLNSDARVVDGAVGLLLAQLHRDPRIGLIGGQLLNADGSAQYSIATAPSLVTELGKKSLLRRLFPRRFYGKRFRPLAPMEVESLVGACVVVRAETVARIGPLDESFFVFLEETDWCVRARAAGFKVVFHPQACTIHLQGQSTQQALAESRIEYWRSRYTYFRKHKGRAQCMLLGAGLLGQLAIDLLFYGVCGLGSRSHRQRLWISCRILLWHLRGRPAHWGLDAGSAASGDAPPLGH
jgi:GT2 family glycosyltransferase